MHDGETEINAENTVRVYVNGAPDSRVPGFEPDNLDKGCEGIGQFKMGVDLSLKGLKVKIFSQSYSDAASVAAAAFASVSDAATGRAVAKTDVAELQLQHQHLSQTFCNSHIWQPPMYLYGSIQKQDSYTGTAY